MSTVYTINKGINRPLEFKGVQAQYLLYMAVGLVALLLLFAILYAIGVSLYICLGIILPAGAALLVFVQTMSHRFGAHGLLKHRARRRLPRFLVTRSRACFCHLSTSDHETK